MTTLNRTILSALADVVRATPEAPAVEENGEIWSYRDLAERARAVASAFVVAGLEHGDRFAIWAPNCREWIIAALGGQMAGGVLVPINTRFKGSEAADILDRSGAKILFTVNGFLGFDYPAMLAGHSLPKLQQMVLLHGAGGKSFDDFVSVGADVGAAVIDARIAAVAPDSLSDILYTSGTTGKPKGAMTTHGQNVEVIDRWCSAVTLSSDDRYLIVNPFFHSFGYKAGWLACILRGACALPHAVFDVDQILGRIAADQISVLPGPPTIFQSLLAREDLGQHDLSSLRATVTGAASVPVQLVRDMKDRLGFEVVLTAYGLTESSGVVSLSLADDDFETIATTSGRPIEGIELKVVDAEGDQVPPNEAGEIWVRGFNVCQGYLDMPEETAEAITEDGWLKTGDIGVQDERGYLKITDRAKDMFITGGFNCYPAEIENILLGHDQVSDVAVIGAPDERMGEVAHAFVVADDEISAQDIVAWAKENMANYKVPRAVHFVDELPRNASGKVQKFKLRNVG
ncbi:MAG: FadD3 family acyl-CoA ligase [Alphaproteobacteria bacterium]